MQTRFYLILCGFGAIVVAMINPIHSVSVATFCDIRNAQGELLAVRNRSEFLKRGRTVYGPVGGGVCASGSIADDIKPTV